MTIDRYEAIALAVIAAGLAVFASVVIPNIKISIVAFSLLF